MRTLPLKAQLASFNAEQMCSPCIQMPHSRSKAQRILTSPLKWSSNRSIVTVDTEG